MTTRTGRPGAASFALAAILVITAAWWTLALWPAGVATPDWVLRTQDACFGSARTGRPDAGGWILLVGEPLGMIGTLYAIAGSSLRRELGGLFGRLGGTPSGQRAVLATGGLVLLGLAPAIVARATAAPVAGGAGRAPTEVQRPAPSTRLVDQYGNAVSLRILYRPAILTVAFAHCETVCPTIVREVQRARERAGRTTMPLFIVTVDPWRDTAERLPTIAREWQLGPDDHVLTGDVGAVERTLDALAVGRARDPDTGNVAHATVVMLLDGHGRITSRFDGDLGQLATRLATTR
ncbi:MAG: SCO family protein [Gemmatimonadetes bacterium]|nr:SCO family protein [Gemmatimonadota bacterium]